ncbi:MAG: hypothetical protein IKE14_06330 [Loktanella sp.]|nr:hypothetical protein [Loktanella sp.]
MRWDKIQITPVVNSDDTQSAKALWLSPNDPLSGLAKACDLAALDMFHCRDLADGLKVIANSRPDIVFFQRNTPFPVICAVAASVILRVHTGRSLHCPPRSGLAQSS